ncbi:MAG: sulfatase-like hydrolase/transferase [Planctomycetales bacterium]
MKRSVSPTFQAALWIAWARVVPGFARAAEKRPNILLIVADDLGYGDLGVHGCQDIPTPHIDSLAAGGIRCESGYVSAPQCAPSRAGLLTGRYQQRFGFEYNGGSPDAGLPVGEITLADRLQAEGYATGLIGKWHLGKDEPRHPLHRGFDEFFGFLGGSNRYSPHPRRGFVPHILRGREPVREQEYLTDAFAREASSFIHRHRDEQFFLYLEFNAPHATMDATENYLLRFASVADEGRRTYAAMVSAMDDAVGTTLDRLRADGLEKNTLIFFISDNGGPETVNHSDNAPLRGVKGELLEGGVRVPFLVQWKGRLPQGKAYPRPVIHLDILPTALAAAGITVPAKQTDGVNLLPFLTGAKQGPPHEILYWRFWFGTEESRRQWAIRQGSRKLVRSDRAPLLLIDLSQDLQETNDLSASNPRQAARLAALWQAWNAELADPAWPLPIPENKIFRKTLIGYSITAALLWLLLGQVQSPTAKQAAEQTAEQTAEPASRSLMVSRLASVAMVAALVGLGGYLIEPDWMRWSAVRLPESLRWTGLGVGVVALLGGLAVGGRDWKRRGLPATANDPIANDPTASRARFLVLLLLAATSACLLSANWFIGLACVAAVCLRRAAPAPLANPNEPDLPAARRAA